MPFYVVLGLLCGLGAFLWIRLLRGASVAFRATRLPLMVRLTLGGAIVGALALWRPEVAGNVMPVIRDLLHQPQAVEVVLLIAGARILATSAAFGSGAVGGVFTPTLFVGAVSGTLLATAATFVPGLPALDPTAFALAGMGGFLAAAANAPVTAILMVFEMSLDHHIVLPLMVTTVVAFFMARRLGAAGIYRESLQAAGPSLFDRELRDLTVADLMRRRFRQVAPTARFSELAAEMLRSYRGQVLVVEGDGRLRGVVRLADIAPYLKDPYIAENVLALDVTEEGLPALAPDTSLPQALEVFSRATGITLPVVDGRDGRWRVLGVLDREDLYLTVSEVTRRSRARPV